IWNNEGKSLYTILDRNLRETDIAAPARTAQAGPGGGRGQGGGRQGGQGRQPDPNTTDPNQPPTDPAQPPPPPPPDPNRPPDPTQPPPTDPHPDNPNRFTPQVDPNAKRDLTWRPDGNGLSALQLEPEKAESKEPRKDQVLQLVAPYGKDDVKVIYA